MKAAAVRKSSSLISLHIVSILTLFTMASAASAATQLLLTRDTRPEGELKGVVELTVAPPADNMKVSISVDGDKLTDALYSPYRVSVDFGARVVEHKIIVTAVTADKKRVQWSTTINKGHLPLTVKLRATDVAKGEFEAATTSPDDDPIDRVELWDDGKVVATATQAPYRFTASPAQLNGFVQVTARTKSGEEAADFWSAAGDVKVENVDVRTVPIFVSVVDRNGAAHDDVDRSLFRVLDNESEGKIVEFGRAFDQPISIAILVDASASMTYAMDDVLKAANGFVKRTLKDGDRCAVFSIRTVPRREQSITSDRAQVEKTLLAIKAQGQTAIYDGITTALRELRDEKNRRAIVILTDGGDTSSISSYEDAEKAAREAGIPIYFIAYESLEPVTAQDIERLRFLAAETGGFVATASQANLSAKYGEIEKDLRAQFAITYQITDFAKRNEWRKVRVVLNSSKLTARTIGGYFAP
jgi:Ca-activated chloride channel homolog